MGKMRRRWRRGCRHRGRRTRFAGSRLCGELGRGEIMSSDEVGQLIDYEEVGRVLRRWSSAGWSNSTSWGLRCTCSTRSTKPRANSAPPPICATPRVAKSSGSEVDRPCTPTMYDIGRMDYWASASSWLGLGIGGWVDLEPGQPAGDPRRRARRSAQPSGYRLESPGPPQQQQHERLGPRAVRLRLTSRCALVDTLLPNTYGGAAPILVYTVTRAIRAQLPDAKLGVAPPDVSGDP